MKIWSHGDLETWRDNEKWKCWRHGDMETLRDGDKDMETSKGKRKRKPGRFPLICVPFAHRANGNLSFVRLLTKKLTKLNGLVHLWLKQLS
jgi:hypothetical protein